MFLQTDVLDRGDKQSRKKQNLLLKKLNFFWDCDH